MSHDQSSLTKTCAICGVLKPLSAFLQFDNASGASYGSICSVCRKTHPDGFKRKTEAEGSTTSQTGHNIDSKAKVFSDIDKAQQKQRIEDEYHKERDENEVIETKQIEKKENIAKDEKNHRKSFLEKRSFISAEKIALKDTKPTASKYAEAANKTASDEKLSRETTANKEKIAKDEKKLSEFDFTAPVLTPGVTGQIRYQGQAFQQFRQWLGNGAPIVKNLEQAAKSNASGPNKEIAERSQPDKTKPGTKRR